MKPIETFIIEHLWKWEAGLNEAPKEKTEEAYAEHFRLARLMGVSNDKDDRGGLTVVGITWKSLKTYCAKKRMSMPKGPDEVTFQLWWEFVREEYIDRLLLYSMPPEIAMMLMDFEWHSGSVGTKTLQKLLGVEADGIVGPKTVAAIKSYSPYALAKAYTAERLLYLHKTAQKGGNEKFIRGWIYRVVDLF